MSNNVNPQVTDGDRQKVDSSDGYTIGLLTDILKELKKINFYNATAHNYVATNEEIE
jgi:hypothetical protein